MSARIVYATLNDGANFNAEFVAYDAATNTEQYMDFYPGVGGDPNHPTLDNSSFPTLFTTLGKQIIFEMQTAAFGRELWVTDGTVAGTHLLKDINTTSPTASHSGFTPGIDSSSFGTDPTYQKPLAFNGYVYFSAAGTDNNFELWRTDGTTQGTTLFKDINTVNVSASSNPGYFFVSGNLMYFDANDGVHGNELWVTDGVDGTAAHTHMVFDLDTVSDGNNGTPPGSTPFNFVTYGNKILFQAYKEGIGDELYSSDGSTVTLVKDIAPWTFGPNNFFSANSNPAYLTNFAGKIFFVADNVGATAGGMQPSDNGQELWSTDGTTANTSMFLNLNSQANGNPGQDQGSAPYDLTVFNGKLYFFANDGLGAGVELWVTDGNPTLSAAHTHLFKDINPLSNQGSFGQNMTVVGNLLFFTADDGSHGNELWVTDGVDNTAAHTHIIDIWANGINGSSPVNLQNVNGTLYFDAFNGTSYGLYKSDGTVNGTVRLTSDYGQFQGHNGFGFVTTGSPFMNFDTDANSDLLWRDTSGVNAVWEMNGNGTIKSFFNIQSVDPSYKLAGTGDFDGDGITDLLWRNTSGVNAVWEMNSNGNIKSFFNLTSVDPSYHLVSAGDFDGDGKTDLLWRNATTGVNAVWEMTGSAANPIKTYFNLPTVDPSYKLAAVGDFNADGISDLLWRDTSGTNAVWEMNANGTIKSFFNITSVDPSFTLAGSGDFDGDGITDLLWRNTTTGVNAMWDMNANGTIKSFFNITSVDSSYHVEQVSDFDGDAHADILWRNTSGVNAIWEMTGNAANPIKTYFNIPTVDPSYQAVGTHFDLI